MAILIVLAHPKKESLNHAIARTAADALTVKGWNVILHDLYAEKFDPMLPTEELAKGTPADPVIRQHIDELVQADGVIIVHPNWWAQPPAILKGWADRVFRMGMVYEFRANDKGVVGPVGLLKARTAMVFNTSNTPRDVELSVYGDPLENLWNTCIFGFCGVKNFYRKQYGPVIISTPEQRAAWLGEIAQTVTRYFTR